MATRATAVATVSKNATTPPRGIQKRILGHKSISIEDIRPNPLNPRRDYHFTADNDEILAMAESLQESGQHDPATVYELAPEEPGKYMLLRGHRRRAGIIRAKLRTLDCMIVERPTSLQEELEWLGSEDGLRVGWGEFTKMKYARDLAKASGYPVVHTKITALTGLPKIKLETTDAIFQLEPEIIDHIAEWEKWEHLTHNTRDHKIPIPTSEYHINIPKFSPERAATVFKIFKSLRANLPDMEGVASLSDLELQVRIAGNTRYDTKEDLLRALAAVDSVKQSPKSGDILTIHHLIKEHSSGKSAKEVVSLSNNKYEGALIKNIGRTSRLIEDVRAMINHTDEIGSDLTVLQEAESCCARLELLLNKLGAKLSNKIANLKG